MDAGRSVVARSIARGGLAAAMLVLAGCGGGGGGSDPSAPAPAPAATTAPPAPGAVLGVTQTAGPPNPALATGGFWEFVASSQNSTSAQGSGGSTDRDVGVFRVTLGAPVVISGRTMHPVTVTGDPSVGGTDLTPRWKFVGVLDGALIGSTDGASVATIFGTSAATGPAKGWFVDARTGSLATPVTATLRGRYNTLATRAAASSSRDGGCETVLGLQFCQDQSSRFSEREHHADGIGPVGFERDSSFSSSGGGFFTSSTRSLRVEIVRTSLAAADGTPIRDMPWREVAPMAAPRTGHAAVASGGRLWVFGGAATGQPAIEVYDPTTNAWSAVNAPLPAGATLAGRRAETVGERSYFVAPNAAVLVFDHRTTTWTTGPSPARTEISWDLGLWNDTATNRPQLVAVWNNRTAPRLDVSFYDTVLGRWSAGTALPAIDRRAYAATVAGNALYLTGGTAHTSTSSSARIDYPTSTIRYDVPSGTWTVTGLGATSASRTDGAAATFAGRPVVLGGRDRDGTVLSTVETYDVATGAWSDVPSMLWPRAGTVAVELAGRLYAVGGSIGSRTVATVEVFTPQ